jgi:hypothetical protein
LYKSASKTNLQAGPEGFAESFGNGLLQADAAYLLLMQNPAPCGGPVDSSSNTTSAGGAWWNGDSPTPAGDSSSASSSALSSSKPSSKPSPSSISSSSSSSKSPWTYWQWSRADSTTSSNDPVDFVGSTGPVIPPPPTRPVWGPTAPVANRNHDEESKGSSWGEPWTWRSNGDNNGNRRKTLRGLLRRDHSSSSSNRNRSNTGHVGDDSITLMDAAPVPV